MNYTYNYSYLYKFSAFNHKAISIDIYIIIHKFFSLKRIIYVIYNVPNQ